MKRFKVVYVVCTCDEFYVAEIRSLGHIALRVTKAKDNIKPCTASVYSYIGLLKCYITVDAVVSVAALEEIEQLWIYLSPTQITF